ncbi:hypothetical protein TWF106_003957 [Orbilia oligospora]|uniref:Carboxymuconolactone decarboxylase-like domain-containing protein n=1 Tax=Orbilia oligospora TaxID=2813651 RepID=A0A6G1LTC3_ORBOL|nr:hypothetical protein TWF679_003208 [Orbilia oligospora]KAF3199273.1 hypothetical protein TWF106_003957 [Orbilia oligospora]KAF3233184.1 hypothetical protein TWF192_002499 [Orbilia oligospora]
MSAVARSILRRRELQRGIGRLCILKSVAALVPHGSLGSPEAPCSRYGSTLASAESNEIQSLLHSNDVIIGTTGNTIPKETKSSHQESTTYTKKDEAEHPPDRTFEEMVVLFREIEASFPKSLGEDRWYLVLIATLTYASDPAHIADLYSYLISQPKYSTSESRKALMRRIREALVKLVCLIGVCKPITAIFRIDDVEKEEDRDYTFSRDGWQADEKNLERGKGFLGKIYRHNMPRNDEKFIAHKDFAWITYNITYGLYLSDHTILDPFDTEVVALCGILIQNLESVTAFHLRGARRLGMTPEDVEGLHACCEKIAGFCRVRVDKVPRVADIEHEVAWE